MIIRPARNLEGVVHLPGDKSISHRAAMLAAIAEGTSRISNFATSADCASTLACMKGLGVEVRQEGSTVWIEGRGLHGLQAPTGPLDCGNSGTTMRLMAGLLAGQSFDSELIGDDSLQKRPMKRVAKPLMSMGAVVATTEGHAPLRISGGNSLRGTEHELEVASAQVKSCVLLAGLYASGKTVVLEPNHSRDHTERMLRRFGVPVKTTRLDGSRLLHSVIGGRELHACDLVVPSDISAAAFFLVGAACLEGSDLTMRGVGLGTGRTGILGILKQCGARVESRLIETNEPGDQPEREKTADIRVRSGFDDDESRPPIRIGHSLIPRLVDEVPILAILGTQITGGIEVRDAGELRVKESDRIVAVVDNLTRMGADVEEFEYGFRVGKSRLRGARVDSFGDHRIAMGFAIAGLFAEGETEIEGAECAAVSFPNFFEELRNVAVYE